MPGRGLRRLGGTCLATFVLLTHAGCKEKQARPDESSVNQTAGDSAEKKAEPHPVIAAPTATSPATAEKKLLPAQISTRWGELKRKKLGPAGPARATSEGVAFVTKDNRLLETPRVGINDFVPLNEKPEALEKYGRGPSISPTHAYWASEQGGLFRGELSSKKVDQLHPSARPYTRTATLRVAGRDLVAFIKQIDENPLAFLWASTPNGKGELVRISPEGSTASSVALVRGSPDPKVLVLAGRSGMSPVHTRKVRISSKHLELAEDEVVWVGPGSHAMTEIHALGRGDGTAVAFLPTIKDFGDFGLAQLFLSEKPGPIAEPSWQMYPNGLDPAPVAAETFCDKDYIVYARPSEQRPYAPQDLHLAAVAGSIPQEGEIIARARAFSDLSLAKTKDGAILAWTAGGYTWGMVLSCPAD